MKRCLRCNSEKIIPSAMVLDKGENNWESDLSVAIDESPDALIFKQRFRSGITADICGECGCI